MAGWHHQCNGPDLGQTLEDGEEQGGLVYCDPWGRKVSDMTGRLNNNNMLNLDEFQLLGLIIKLYEGIFARIIKKSGMEIDKSNLSAI